MQFSQFSRAVEGLTIRLYTDYPIARVGEIKFFKDNASGSFAKKEFRWSFNNDYWASWQPLTQTAFSAIATHSNYYLFLEIRYVLSSTGSGTVSTFEVNYAEGAIGKYAGVLTEDIQHQDASAVLIHDIIQTYKTVTLKDSSLLGGKSGAYYLDRARHTGTQAIDTISGLVTALQDSATYRDPSLNELYTTKADISYIDITYDQLVSKVQTQTLVPNAAYRLTDFATTHYFINDTSTIYDINVGATEPLILKASTSNTFEPIVSSLIYHNDIIHYDWDPSNWIIDRNFSNIDVSGAFATIIPGWKGIIFYREDTIRANSTYYDFRNVKFRRWKIDASTWSASTTYPRGAYVKSGTNIYVSSKNDNLNKAVSLTAFWSSVVDISNTVYWSWKSTSCNGISVDPNTYSDVYTFNRYDVVSNTQLSKETTLYDSNGVSNILNNIVFIGPDTSSLANQVYNNVFYGFANRCTIGKVFCNNTLYHIFTNNIIGDLFTNNIVNGFFQNNVIRDNFTFNTIGKYFFDNRIGSWYSVNVCDDYFSNNIINYNCYYNNFSLYFTGNSVDVWNYYNNYGVSAIYNILGPFFTENTIGTDFMRNTIQDYFYNNACAGLFSDNSIGSTCNNNTFSCNVTYNNIGTHMNKNNIGPYFFSNTINNYFNQNLVGASFAKNIIPTQNFGSNTIMAGFNFDTVNTYTGVNFTGATHVYQPYSVELFKNSAGARKLRYYDASDNSVVNLANA